MLQLDPHHLKQEMEEDCLEIPITKWAETSSSSFPELFSNTSTTDQVASQKCSKSEAETESTKLTRKELHSVMESIILGYLNCDCNKCNKGTSSLKGEAGNQEKQCDWVEMATSGNGDSKHLKAPPLPLPLPLSNSPVLSPNSPHFKVQLPTIQTQTQWSIDALRLAHVRRGRRLYHCPNCSVVFATRSHLAIHLRWHATASRSTLARPSTLGQQPSLAGCYPNPEPPRMFRPFRPWL